MTDIGIQDRRKEAFQSMAVGELPALYSLARRLVRDGAEDLVQETLTRAYRSFGALKEDEAGARWLKSILVNVFRDELRKRARSVEELPVEEVEDFSLYRTLVEVDPLPYSDTLHLDFLRAFGKDDVREVLMRLPVLYRAPLVLRYMDGFATKEIARMLDSPLGTILARLHRGRKRFEAEMRRRRDSSWGRRTDDRPAELDPVLRGCEAALGLPRPRDLGRGSGEGGEAPVVLPHVLRGAGVREGAPELPCLE
jgi:RNA polymerase sigma-70 factor (ECF subfamily)